MPVWGQLSGHGFRDQIQVIQVAQVWTVYQVEMD